MQDWHPSIVYILGELVSCPFFLTIQGREAELVDQVAIEASLVFFNQGVMAVDSYDGRPLNLLTPSSQYI